MARGLACSAGDWPKERPKGEMGGVSVSGAAPGGTGAERVGRRRAGLGVWRRNCWEDLEAVGGRVVKPRGSWDWRGIEGTERTGRVA